MEQIFEAACLVVNFWNFFNFIRQSWDLGRESLTRLWSWIDLIIISLNFTVSADIIRSVKYDNNV